MTGRSDRSAGMGKQHMKHPDKDLKEQNATEPSEFIGIYNNANVTHVLTSLIGVHLRVETKKQG